MIRSLADVRLLKQLILTFSVILVVNLVIGIYFTTKIRDLKTLVEVMYDNPLMASTFAMSAKFRFERADSLVRTALVVDTKKEFEELIKEIDSQIEQGDEDLVVVQERAVAQSSKEIAELVQSKVNDYKIVIRETLKRAEDISGGTKSYATIQNNLQKYLDEDVRNVIQKKLTDLTDDAAETGYTFRLDSEAKNSETVRFFYFGSATIVLITFLLAFLLSRTIATPLARYSKTCLEISAGDYKQRVSVFGEESEIAVLGRSFNLMLDRVAEKDRNMKSLLDGLTTAVFSFNATGTISSEKSIACAQVFGDQPLLNVVDFLKINSGLDVEGTKESLELLWNPDTSIDFDSLATGVFPSHMALPFKAAEPTKFIALTYRQNLNSDGNLEKIIVLANDITDSTLAERNSLLQAERVDRLTKASQSAENYIESKNNFIMFIKSSKQIVGKNLAAVCESEMADLKRQLHSLKGELSLMGHKTCARLVHDIETSLADGSAKDELVLDAIKKIERSFVAESDDVLAVLGLDETSKMIKVNEEKIEALISYVKAEPLFQEDQKLQLLAKLTGLMQKPIKHFLKKYEEYVTTTAEKLGKIVALEFDDKSDEISFNEIQKLDSAFGHLLRNSLDHGIEFPEDRTAAGKDARGKILIAAKRDIAAKKIIFKISDDGRGIDHNKLSEKAVLKNIWSAEQAKNASKDEALNLIFLSDFSTKEVITETSGRGVGMDAVRADIENLGGKIDLQTEIKKGTRFTLVIPT